MSKEGVGRILEISDLKELVDEISANIPLYYTDQQEILNQTDFWKRYEMLAFKLVNEVQIMDIKDDIRAKVKERVDKHQREYILREQLKLIREELGDDTTLSDAEEFEQAAKKLKAPKEVKDKLAKGQLSPAGESYGGTGVTLIPENKLSEATAALAVLGYSQGEINIALKGIDLDGQSLEQVIKQALKKMVKG